MQNKTKVWITKYALTRGVFVEYVRESTSVPGMVEAERFSYYHENEWHRTESEAMSHARKMRDKKILSLRKQIERISSIKFGD